MTQQRHEQTNDRRHAGTILAPTRRLKELRRFQILSRESLGEAPRTAVAAGRPPATEIVFMIVLKNLPRCRGHTEPRRRAGSIFHGRASKEGGVSVEARGSDLMSLNQTLLGAQSSKVELEADSDDRRQIGDLHVCFCNRFFSRLFFYVHFGLGPCGSSHQRQMDLSAFFAGPLAWSTHGRSPLNETRAGLLEFHWSAR